MREGGFTLMEMIAVVLIIAIMAGVALTRIDSLVPRYRLRGAARELGAAFGEARARAVSSGKDVYFEVNLAKGTYWQLVASPKLDPAGGEEQGPRALEYKPLFGKAVASGVEFVDLIFSEKERVAEGVARVRISPFGASQHLIVNLRNDEGRLMALKLNGLTGNVSFYEERKEADELLEDSDP